MHIRQFVAPSLGDASYLVASGSEAAVIDPQRDIRPYVAAAEDLGVAIRFVFETHVHNDYVSGGPELVARGATVIAPADSGLEFAHRPVVDGDEVAVGTARIRAVGPGSTTRPTSGSMSRVRSRRRSRAARSSSTAPDAPTCSVHSTRGS